MSDRYEGTFSFFSPISANYQLSAQIRAFSYERGQRETEKKYTQAYFNRFLATSLLKTNRNNRSFWVRENRSKFLKMPGSLKNSNFVPLKENINFPRRKSNMAENDKAFLFPLVILDKIEVKKSQSCQENYLRCQFCAITLNRNRLSQIFLHSLSHVKILVEELPNWAENFNNNEENFVPEIFAAAGLKIAPQHLANVKKRLLPLNEITPKNAQYVIISLRCPTNEKTFFLCSLCSFLGDSLDSIKAHLKNHVALLEINQHPTLSLCLTDEIH